MANVPARRLHCRNCGGQLGSVAEALIWENRPAWLSPVWMPVAIVAVGVAAVLAVAVVVLSLREPDVVEVPSRPANARPAAEPPVVTTTTTTVPVPMPTPPTAHPPVVGPPAVKVVSAEWGQGANFVDVRRVVADRLAKGGKVMANNGPLGMRTDPATNQRKVLRLKLAVGEKTLTLGVPEDGTIVLQDGAGGAAE